MTNNWNYIYEGKLPTENGNYFVTRLTKEINSNRNCTWTEELSFKDGHFGYYFDPTSYGIKSISELHFQQIDLSSILAWMNLPEPAVNKL